MRSSFFRGSFCIRAAILLLAVAVFAGGALAQERMGGSSFLPPEAKVRKWLSNAEQLLGEKRHGEAVGFLQMIIEHQEDYFETGAGATQVSFKTKAWQMLHQDPETRKAYQLQFATRAERDLQAAVNAGQTDQVAAVYRRFFHTPAGYQAAYLLGNHFLDRGQPIAAALCFERLQAATADYEPLLSLQLARAWQAAGKSGDAQRVLTALRARAPNARVEFAGRDVPLFSDDARALDWLAATFGPPPGAASSAAAGDWTMVRGDVARSANCDASLPLLGLRWRVPMFDSGDIRQDIEKSQVEYRDRLGIQTVPSVQPLVVRDMVVFRTVNGLWGADFQTGLRKWVEEQPIQEFFRKSQQMMMSNSYGFRAATLGDAVEQRLWSDLMYGMLSSDGERVYAVQDLTYVEPVLARVQVFMPRGNLAREAALESNRLQARDVVSGKIRWEIGGSEGAPDPALANAFFLGPPLCLNGELYVLAEVAGIVRLVALEARSGAFLWSQQLVVVDQRVTQDAQRRLAGISPSYADGLLLCPTSADAMVAVDINSHTLRWGYRYDRSLGGKLTPNQILQMQMNGQQPPNTGQGWTDSLAIVADGRVLLTPVGSNSLHCVSLTDGKALWTADRQQGLYVAGVHQGQVIVVEANKLRAIDLATGKASSVWPGGEVPLPAGSLVSGRGLLSKGVLYLPLTSAEIAAVDLARGQITARARSRSGHVPGNLVAYGDSIISQGADYLDCYYRVDHLEEMVARQLRANAADPDALLLRGELQLDRGELAAAAENLRKAYALQPDVRSRELLVEALLSLLQTDFNAHRGLMSEIEPLLESSEQQARYQRVVAVSLHKAGEHAAAMQHYVRLLESDDGVVLENVGPQLKVRRDRWIKAQLAELYQASSEDARRQFEAMLAQRVAAAMKAEDAAPLMRLADTFGEERLGEEVLGQLVERLWQSGNLLQAEYLALRLAARNPRSRTALATMARLAAWLHERGRHAEAAWYYRRLAAEFSDQIILDGQTGQQLAAALPESKTRQLLAGGVAWPNGQVEVADGGRVNSNERLVPMELLLDGSAPPICVEWDQSRNGIVGKDGLGQRLWNLSLNQQASTRFWVYPALNQARLHGHVLIFAVGGQELFAVDTLGSGTPKLLWRQDLIETFTRDNQALMGVRTRSQRLPWGVFKQYPTDQLGNPLTGVTLWRHGDLWPKEKLAPGTIFGDDELLFVIPQSRPGTAEVAEAVVLRTIDGQLLERRPVPKSDQLMLAHGRHVLAWVFENGKVALRYRDVWQDKTVWEATFANNSKGYLIQNEAVAILQPDGQYTVLRIADGTPLISSQVEREAALTEMYTLADDERIYLIANGNRRDASANYPMQIPNGAAALQVNGRVYGFDRKNGKQVWVTEVNNQFLVPAQPPWLPVFVFACQIYRRVGNNSQIMYSVNCLDKRSGRMVYQPETQSAPLTHYDVSGDIDTQTVTLDLAGKQVKLKLTDKPWPMPEEAPREAPDPKEEKKP